MSDEDMQELALLVALRLTELCDDPDCGSIVDDLLSKADQILGWLQPNRPVTLTLTAGPVTEQPH